MHALVYSEALKYIVLFPFIYCIWRRIRRVIYDKLEFSRFLAYALNVFPEYTAWAAFGGRKLEVT